MLSLHALWDDAQHQLHLWLERPPRTTQTSQTSNANANTSRHPGARGHTALTRATAAWLGKSIATNAQQASRKLILPTVGDAPLSSPELNLPTPTPGQQPVTWQAWRVPMLAPHNPSAALRRLAKTKLPEGATLSASAKFWAAASQLVDDLIARRAFAPYAGDAEHTLLARWSPLYDAEASAGMRALAAAMPGVCSALVPHRTHPAQHRPPDALPLLSSFVEYLLDVRARRALRPKLREEILTANGGDDRSKPARWLRRLAGRAENAYLPLIRFDDVQLGETLRTWLTPLHVLPAAKGRLCVQLDEPETNDKDALWHLWYFLQDVDEPSVLIPVRQIWHQHGRDAVIAQRRFIDAHQTLLAELARAAPLCPPIADSLRLAAPERAPIGVSAAHEFLRAHATALENAGIGVRLPAWWREKREVTVQLTLPESLAFFGVETLVKFDWQAALGDALLTRAEFETLSRLKAPLARVRGQWVEVNADSLQRALRFFEKHKRGLTLSETLRVATNGAEGDIGLRVGDVSAKGHVRHMLDRLRGARQITQVQPAKTFAGKLRPYQQRGLSWLAFLSEFGLGACLADDMGLGKTVQLLALAEHWRANDAKPGPILLVCPMSIVGNWQREAARFAPQLKVLVHHGAGRLAGKPLHKAATRHDLVLTTYNLAHRDQAGLRAVKWRAVVLDEAQNVKTHDSKQAQAVRTFQAQQRVALTGTPVENRLTELWSILDFLNPGYLGSKESFQERYGRDVERGDANKAADLRRIVQPFLLRRVKTDKSIISDLPDKFEHTVYCNLTREQATLYQAVTRNMLEQISEAVGLDRARLILMALMKLKQVCNHPAHYLGDASRLANRSGKLARLEAMLEEALSAGDKALIFSQYTEMGRPLQHYLQQLFKREVLFLHGQVPQKKRDEMVWRFQEEPKGPPIFVLSLKAGGTGLNLTAANHVFHFDRWWNPAVENQATDRAYRIGQRRDVQVHKLVCLGTLEERIDQMLTKKRTLAESIVGNGEGWLTELSTNQLRDLFTMSDEAVGD
jgi:SNF2 family DNA or RNA helicase